MITRKSNLLKLRKKTEGAQTFLIVGLGNPGETYAFHRHNVGFRFLDTLAKTYNLGWKNDFSGMYAQLKHMDAQVILLKPQTFMNLSGLSVAAIMRFYKIPLQHVWVIHDDIDLPFAKIRIKKGGGAGGHNGLKSIDQHIGPDYHRLRFGVSRPVKGDTSNYVLSHFSLSQEKELGVRMQFFVENFLSLLGDNVDHFLKNYDKIVSDEK